MRWVHHDSTEKAKSRASGGAGGGATGGNGRGVAGAKPQQQAPALGAIESAQPRADSHDCRGAGAAADARAIARIGARTAELSYGRSGAAGGPLAGIAGRGSTTDTTARVKVAAQTQRRDTFSMAVPNKRGPLLLAMLAVTFSAIALSARADEIRLKDGKKLYGVIVAYEDNMFKVKTDFGYVLVEKDKIAAIVPSTPGGSPEPASAGKKDAAQHPAKPAGDSHPQAEPAVASSFDATATPTNASAKTVSPGPAGKADKAPPKITNATVRPEVPANTAAANVAAPTIKGSPAATESGLTASAPSPAPPKEPEVPANREEIQGNLYTNYTHGFRMYKAPSWSLIEEARGALPNAIVAMGTSNESTLMVVGEEKTKEPLETAAAAVESRLHDVYANYQRLSERKSVVGGLPAVEYRYRGKADEHDWSGKLVVVARGKDMFTVLAMTYADSDLIQIQENVIARAIASLDFSAH